MKRAWFGIILLAALSGAVPGRSWGNHVFMHGGPFGGVVLGILPDPEAADTLYLASFGSGVFKSVDGGRRWEDRSRGLGDLGVMTLAVDPADSQVLYAGTDSGVFVTRNGGARWSHATGAIQGRNVRSLLVLPARPTVVYAATDQGVLWSQDGARSWAPRNTGLSTRDIRVLRADPFSRDRLFAAGFGGVFKSEDGGRRWRAITQGLTNLHVRDLAVDPARAGVLYAGTSGGGVFRTAGGGDRWQPLNDGLDNVRVLSLVATPAGALFTATVGGVYRQLADRSAWERVGEGPLALTVTFVRHNPHRPGTLYAGTGGLVFVTEDHGRQWRELAMSVVSSADGRPTSIGSGHLGTVDSREERR